MAEIRLLIGMIGSGKTTYARAMADTHGDVIVSHDDLTEMLHGRYTYHQALKPMYLDMMKSLAMVAIGHGKNVIIDRTHLTRESRAFWVDVAKKANIYVVAVGFKVETPEVHAQRRFKFDPRGRPYDEWLNVAKHHAAQIEAEPLDWDAEGFDWSFEADSDLTRVMASPLIPNKVNFYLPPPDAIGVHSYPDGSIIWPTGRPGYEGKFCASGPNGRLLRNLNGADKVSEYAFDSASAAAEALARIGLGAE